jgi:hypothetical protein
MDLIERSIDRLYDNVSRFIDPSSAALRDIELLKAQIELRRLALRDIEVIRYGLRPLIGGRTKERQRKQLIRRVSWARLDAGRVRGHF